MPIEIRTVGTLAHKEEKVISVNTKFEGWIENAHFNNVGEAVNKGDVLFEIYSPQLVTTQREYLAAMDYVERRLPRRDRSRQVSSEVRARAPSLLGHDRRADRGSRIEEGGRPHHTLPITHVRGNRRQDGRLAGRDEAQPSQA